MTEFPEEVTQDNIKKLLDKLPNNLTPVERMLLCHDGTNQTLLSILFQVPVKVEILSQYELVPYCVIVRWVKLIAEYSDINQATVCLAESVFPMKANNPGFLTAIREQKLGIGQILSATHIIYERRIFGLYADENVVARNYEIVGEGVSVVITETFPRNALEQAGKMK